MAVMMNGWTVTDEFCLLRDKTVGVFFGEMKATIFGVRSFQVRAPAAEAVTSKMQAVRDSLLLNASSLPRVDRH